MSSASPCLILASSSPRRSALLQQIGIDFFVVAPQILEEMREGEDPQSAVIRLALEKAMDVSKRSPLFPVLGADTIVLLGEEIMGKPRDEKDAQRMLNQLSGKEHRVITGVALVKDGGQYQLTRSVKTSVKMKRLTKGEIERYIRSGEPMGKAGAYAIQGKGALFIERIKGCYTNVVGLPIPTVGKMLRKAGIVWTISRGRDDTRNLE
ncbi:MAG: septum formation inhibitor Maf [Candidatus Tectomicrobia bacterium]|nr:septum formation inhibitor Maf [Candidatus Tectomicrobia bacterium]